MFDCADNKFLNDTDQKIAIAMTTIRSRMGRHPEHMAKSQAEHLRLVDAVESSGLTSLWCGFPRQEIVDPVDLVVWDSGKCVGQPGLQIDAIQFGCFDQGVGDGGSFATGL